MSRVRLAALGARWRAARALADRATATSTLPALACDAGRAAGDRADCTSDGAGARALRAVACGGAVLASLLGVAAGTGFAAHCEEARRAADDGNALPAYTREEVAKHNAPDKRVWVTYQGGVYDVTEFLEQHPGGAARLMLAAGGAIDPFWNMYKQHQTQEVRGMLEEYRIGTLEGGAALVEAKDPYEAEPERHPALIVRTQQPMNAETPPDVLAQSPITPTELFYVRNHLPVPHIDASDYSLGVGGEGLRTLELSLQDLQRNFRKHTVVATIQCSGNRRHQLAEVKPIKGLDWDVGAIGTAEFSGVRLSDVLAAAGLDAERLGGVEHIQFEGLDADISGTCYGASIPVDVALTRSAEVLLAYEMNGRPLPLDHGFPVRVVVPGVTGARSVKWLSRIIASKEESQSHWQQKDYKSFSPSVDWDTVDWASAPAIQETNVQSAICSPQPGATLEGAADSVAVRGYAFSGGGRRVIRVDVSADGGKTWTTASLAPADKQSRRGFAWTLWEAEVQVPRGAQQLDLCCRATDDSYNSQPDEPAGIWNLRGVMNNAVHHVKVQLAA